MCTFRVEQHVAADNVQAMLEAFFRDRLVTGVLHRLTGPQRKSDASSEQQSVPTAQKS